MFAAILCLFLNPSLQRMTPNDYLVAVGRSVGVKSLATGKKHALLQKLAEDHAAYQARVQRQGHQNFNARYQRIMAEVPGLRSVREVANESWNGQSLEEAAPEMYNSWKKSRGHWSAVNGSCKYWGYAMVQGRNGTWYACAIFAE